MKFRIYRLRRKGKKLRDRELMHNAIEAGSKADALQRYHLLAPDVDLRDVKAREG